MSVAEWVDTYGIHHWRILWSSYRKLAWLGFEPTTTEFRSDALTDWAIRPWVQIALRANFVQLLQFQFQKELEKMVSNFYILSLKRFRIFFVFTEEIALKHFLFTNITKFRFFLFFSDHTDIKKWKSFRDYVYIINFLEWVIL